MSPTDKILQEYRQIIESEYQNSDRFPSHSDSERVVTEVMDFLNQGQIRVAEFDSGGWMVHEWIKKAILLYFRLRKIEIRDSQVSSLNYVDKIPVKQITLEDEVRIIPPAVVRYGAFVAKKVVLMPSFVNIGAYVDSGTMVDTWATVGSCAQIGKSVHLSGGVGIGGVLEPPQASPVIIEDDCFIGSRCIVVEGVRVRRGAVLGAGVILTGSTKIIDVTGSAPREWTGEVPERAVVIPGSRLKKYPAGEFAVGAALLIGYRNSGTDSKTSLNQVLRDFGVSV